MRFYLAILIVLCASTVVAIPQFREGFIYRYGLEQPRQQWQRRLAVEIEVAKCTACHSPRSKKMFNPYGQFLSLRLDKRDFKSDSTLSDKEQQQRILQALRDAEQVPRFRTAIDAGHLPR